LESESSADARASVLQAALNYGNERSFNGRVDRELERLRPTAVSYLRQNNEQGVVAVIGFSQSEHYAGSRKMFRWANLIGPPYIFRHPQAGIDHFQHRPHAASNDGTNANRHKFFWGYLE
jgi:hypothetical protein